MLIMCVNVNERLLFANYDLNPCLIQTYKAALIVWSSLFVSLLVCVFVYVDV